MSNHVAKLFRIMWQFFVAKISVPGSRPARPSPPHPPLPAYTPTASFLEDLNLKVVAKICKNHKTLTQLGPGDRDAEQRAGHLAGPGLLWRGALRWGPGASASRRRSAAPAPERRVRKGASVRFSRWGSEREPRPAAAGRTSRNPGGSDPLCCSTGASAREPEPRYASLRSGSPGTTSAAAAPRNMTFLRFRTSHCRRPGALAVLGDPSLCAWLRPVRVCDGRRSRRVDPSLYAVRIGRLQ